MSIITVKSEHQYDVVIGNDWLSELTSSISKYDRIAFFYSESQAEHIPKLSIKNEMHYFPLPDGESAKSAQTLAQMWDWMGAAGFTRSDLVVAIGGGTVTDAAGFLSATWLRGIDWIAIPTTLAGMVDASVGGKNGVDLGNLKNQIGVINVPKLVLIDTDYLSTLPQNEMRSGLAEMLKHGLIADADYWTKFKELNGIDFADFDGLIYRSIEIKNEIVMQDPTENGIRMALNFGHTLGHAIESYFLENEDKKTLLHGEAIAVGMILESYISWQKKLLSAA